MPLFISRLTDRLFKSLFGDDIFISYSRADGATYAAGLANELVKRGFSCRLDQWGTESGSEMPESLKKALRRSVALVLLGTNGAAQSRHVADEVRELKRMGRMIVPVVFDGVLLKNDQTVKDGALVRADSPAGAMANEAIWAGEIEGLPMSCESREALRTGEPSPMVLNRIEKTCNFWKKDKRLRLASSVVAGILICLLGASAAAGVVAVKKGAEAASKTADATAAEKRAGEQETIAAQKTKDANVATERARQADEKAATATRVADEKTRLADEATKRAERQQSLAEKKTREAAAATDRAAKADERAKGAERTAEEKSRQAEEASKEADRQTMLARQAGERADKARRYADSQEIRAALIDDRGEHTPYEFDRWQRLNDLLVRAVGVPYDDGANIIRARLRCLPSPTVRHEVATLNKTPLALALNNAGTRLGAVYRDRVVIYDPATGDALHSVRLGKPLGVTDVVYAETDPFNDRMLFSVEDPTANPFARILGEYQPRSYFFKYFDDSAPVRVNVPEKLEGNMLHPNYGGGAKYSRGAALVLKALASLASDDGELKDLSRVFDGLKRNLSLGENSSVAPLEYDPRTGVGIYKIYTVKNMPAGKLKDEELKHFGSPYYERVVLYDGKDKVATLHESGEKDPDDDVTFERVNGIVKLVVQSWGDEYMVTALNAQKRLALLDNKLFSFSEDWRVESSESDLPLAGVSDPKRSKDDDAEGEDSDSLPDDHASMLKGVNSLKLSEDGGTIVVYFADTQNNGAGLPPSKSVGVFDVERKALHRFFLPEQKKSFAVGPRGERVFFVTSGRKLEVWNTSPFSSNGWVMEGCTAKAPGMPAEIAPLQRR